MKCCLGLLAMGTGALLLAMPHASSSQSSPSMPQTTWNVNWNADEKAAAEFLHGAENELLGAREKKAFAYWAYATDMTNHNEDRNREEQGVFNALEAKLSKEALAFRKSSVQDEVLKRKLKKLVAEQVNWLPKEQSVEFNGALSQMKKIYNRGVVANRTNLSQLLSPDVVEAILQFSRDPMEMAYYWKALKDARGTKMRKHFMTVIELTNEIARLNGLADGAEWENLEYESATFIDDMAAVWAELRPLYLKFHAYIRHKLQERYGKSIVHDNAPVPVHLTQWKSQVDFLKPYPNKPDIDVTDQMRAQGWTIKTLFQKADKYYQSIGLDPLPQGFWSDSLLEAPTDGRSAMCFGSAHDFYNGKDFRIKMCTGVSQFDFYMVTHEMGHIQYQMSYRNQSYLFRDAPIPALHEGVADIMSLAVGTTSYLKQIGLLTDSADGDDTETNINILFNSAMLKLRWMPANYMFDKFKWDLFSGKVNLEDLNCHWVKLSADIQGEVPPVMRNEEGFDGSNIYHLAHNVPVIQYFVALIYQFQFYRELCLEAKQYEPGNKDKPLYRCNLHGSKEAGRKLYKMLTLGASKPWQKIIEVMTGEPKMSAQAYIEYFAPLEEWLDEYIEANNLTVGWKNPDYSKLCSKAGEAKDVDQPTCTLDTCQ